MTATRSAILASVLLFSVSARAAEFNLGELAKAGKINVHNRTLNHSTSGSSEVVLLDAAPGDGLAWIDGVVFSAGTIELEIRGRNRPGQSFVGIAFHGQDNQAFDAVYLRPFNFQSAERGNHSLQYISMPEHDWSELRSNHPGKFESAIKPAPDPESCVTLKLVVTKTNVTAYVNGAEQPALKVDLLSERSAGKVGLWVGNGSDGWFRNLKIEPRE
ncbi:hypothetical protein GC207_03930 [bacterium]|nr:hypothetical protein [bacterium]